MKKKKSDQSYLLRVEYVPLSTVKLWDRNPKRHDIPQIIESIYRYGFQDPAKFDETLGGLVFGNGRTEALITAKAQGKQPPRGVMLDAETGEWGVPVLFGNDLASVNAASAFAIDHNNLTMAGSHTPEDMALMWTAEGYQSLMSGLKDASELPLTAWSGAGDDEPEGVEIAKEIQPMNMARVLISFPVDISIQVSDLINKIQDIPGVEVDYGAN